MRTGQRAKGDIGARNGCGRNVVREQRFAPPEGKHLRIGVRVVHGMLR